jgi:hypothetical protein
VTRLLLAQNWEYGLGDIDYTHEIGVDLGTEVLDINVLDSNGVGISCIVDDDVDAAELVMACLDGFEDLLIVGDIEGHREDSIAAILLQ